MTEFLAPIDIGNRACQHLGARRIDPTLGFNEISVAASEIGACYGKLRRAELERNVWTFATRRAILRAVDTNTMLLAPTLWSASTTYFQGSIVADASGNLWQSRIPSNTGNDPTLTLLWEPYFGPMTADPYDSTTTYSAGEIVYTYVGDGSYNVYLSRISGNALDPSLPAQWSIAATYAKGDVVQVYPAWASGTTYAQGAGVQYTDGNWYASLTAGNVGNAPTSSPASWALMPVATLQSQATAPGSSPVIEWQSGTVYSVGAFVMFNGTLYLSIQANNTGHYPNTSGSAWAAVSGGVLYMSAFDLNINNNPSSSAPLWQVGVTYPANANVTGSDGIAYSSIGSGNVGHDPTLDGGVHWTNTGKFTPWTTVFTQGGGNSQWLQIGGASFPAGVVLTRLQVQYPINSGPAWQAQTRNVFRLPNGFLKLCSQDPKAGSVSFLGAPTGLAYKDWLIENGYLVSADVGPIMLRFVADVTDVSTFHTLFCEGLAAGIGKETCEKVTQSNAKYAVCEKAYDRAMGTARTVNAIEVGSEEAPTDDWLSCRY